jgi:hypothetical protein
MAGNGLARGARQPSFFGTDEKRIHTEKTRLLIKAKAV